MKKVHILTLAVMFLAACSKENSEISPASTEQTGLSSNGNSAKASVSRPFSATINASADANPNIPPTACSGDLPGFSAPDFLLSGTATHMGPLGQISRLHHDNCDLSFTTALLTTHVTVTLEADNGDLVYCSGDDVVNVYGLLTQTSTTGSITGTWTITGGTGRFTGAGGSFNINGTVDFATNSFSCVCAGSITY